MEARSLRAVSIAALLLVSMGARFRTANFIVETADPRVAQQVAEAAESYRAELAESWLGEKLPNWSKPCPMTVKVGPKLGACGKTTFVFDRGEVYGWQMEIQGTPERVLDSVLPHEITHMLFASHFRRPLPRWADEGGATSVEHVSERNKQRTLLDQYLRTGRGIAFSKMFAMTEYPPDVLPLYAQGYSAAEFLIQIGGRRRYITFIEDGLPEGKWGKSLQKNYNIANLGELQTTWLAWVKQGAPLKSNRNTPAAQPSAEMLAVKERFARPEASRNLPSNEASVPRPKAAVASNEVAATEPSRSLPLVPVAHGIPGAEGRMVSGKTSSGPRSLVPYTPGSTVAVSRLSIPSTGWRASNLTPVSYRVIENSSSKPDLSIDSSRTEGDRAQPLESPKRTSVWR